MDDILQFLNGYEIKKNIESITKGHIDNSLFKEFITDKKIKGKSGAKFKIIGDKFYKMSSISWKVDHEGICRKVSSQMNEFIINYIFKNKYGGKKNILKINNYFFNENKNKIILEMNCLSFRGKDNLYKVFDELIPKNLSNLPYLDAFITKNLLIILKILYRLQDDLQFIHGDLKLENVFVNEEANSLIPMLADFDKSSLIIKGIKILSKQNYNEALFKVCGQDLVYASRHCCEFRFDKYCEGMTQFMYDPLCLFISTFLLLQKHKVLRKMKNLIELCCKILEKNNIESLLNFVEKCYTDNVRFRTIVCIIKSYCS